MQRMFLFLFAFFILNATAHSAPAAVPKTGQTSSYAARDDGDLERGVAWPAVRFTDNGSGTVTDNLTGLVWTRDANLMSTRDPGFDTYASSGYVPWQRALDYVKKLNAENYLGHSDWRLPNVDELESLVDLQRHDPALPTGHPFNNVQASWYWSSSTYAYRTYHAWLVRMDVGYVNSTYKADYGYYVWPVRSGQSGSLGSLGISFASIPAQSVNNSFTTTISAYDAKGAGQTGWVRLSLASGNRLSPTWVYLPNGVWNGSLTLYSPEADARIIGVGLGLSGSSNNFAVTDPANQTASGTFTGKVTNRSTGAPLAGVNVNIKGQANSVNITVTTDSTGRFKQYGFPAGTYDLYASNGIRDGGVKPAYVGQSETSTVNLTIALAAKPPVIIVPGVMGSTRESVTDYYPYPKLPDEELDRNRAGELKILDPKIPLVGEPVGARQLRDYLKGDFTVYPTPWDWRMETDRAVNEFLKPMIDKAKKETGYSKVNIVAHSQGGLLTRAYIQGDKYADDVDKFIMLGTPNQGSAIPYWLLEGGDPKTIDDLTEETLGDKFAHFYSHAANRLYKASTGKNAFKTCLEVYGGSASLLAFCSDPYDGLEFNKMKISKKDMKMFLQNYIGPKRLMATYDPFLIDSRSAQHIAASNAWLRGLNADSQGLGRMTRLDASDYAGKVRTALFLSKDQKTLHEVKIDTGRTAVYDQGEPLGYQQRLTPGDGTVPTEEAKAPFKNLNNALIIESDRGKHSGLMGAFRDEVLTYLCLDGSCGVAKVAAKTTSLVAEAATLSIALTGRIQPYLTDPNSLTNGVNPATGEFSETIPTSTTVLNSGSSLITIDTPADGVYTLAFKGQTDDIYELSINYADGTAMETQNIRGVQHTGITTLTFTVSGAATPKLNVTIPVAPPTNVTATNNTGKARISWTASTDPAVSTYDIYARRFDQPTFSLLTSTAAASFDTAHVWNSGGTGEGWSYLVIARKGAAESFFDSVVENRDYMVANFTANKTSGVGPLTVTFTDNSSGSITGRQWDFDGDGTTDSTETNPVYTYAIPGSYTVTLTVTGPDGNDQQTRTSYVVVTSVPVNGACGNSSGQYFTVAPTTNLCTTGTATIVTGTGPWSWSCTGSNGGTNASCSANLLKPGDCDNSGTVTIAEVQSAINMFLQIKPVAGCVDTNGDGNVAISEVQKVINGFLGL